MRGFITARISRSVCTSRSRRKRLWTQFLMMPAAVTGERRFPSPWKVEELEVCFFVTDNAGQKLAHVYFEDEPGRRAAAKLLSKDEARR